MMGILTGCRDAFPIVHVFPALSRSPVRELFDVRFSLGEHEVVCCRGTAPRRRGPSRHVRARNVHEPPIDEAGVQAVIDKRAALLP
jgi:hypothetical protein